MVLVLIALSPPWFLIVEPAAFGLEAWGCLLAEYRAIPFTLALYGMAITPLTAGICEEIIWRGYLQTRLEPKLGDRGATTAQAVLFGLWHGPSPHAIFTAVFGLLFGFIYAKTRRLIPLMVAHWLGDVVGFSAMYLSA